jgi:hypothetical protein
MGQRLMVWGTVLAGALLTIGAHGQPAAPAPATPGPSSTLLPLSECLRLSMAERSKVRTARLIVEQREGQAAEVARLARTLGLVRPELKVRREQAALAAEVARVTLTAQEADVRYAVARTYLSVLYARSGRQLARQAARNVQAYQSFFGGLKSPVKALDPFPFVAELFSVPALQVEARLIDADRGEAVALAALKQAIGFDVTEPLDVPTVPLPRPATLIPEQPEVLRLVQERNPALRRAALFEQIMQLEAEAQKRIRLTHAADTFAAASDIHSSPPPPQGSEYRPAPVVPEMPVRLVGARDVRVRSAELYAAKASESTRGVSNLVNLRSVAVHQTLLEKRRKLEVTEKWLRERADRFQALLRRLPPKLADEAALRESILTITALADRELARWEYLIALLELERLTLGGFSSGIVEALEGHPAPPTH